MAVEFDDAAVARRRGILEHSTARAVSRGKLTPEDRTVLLGRLRLRLSSGLDGLAARSPTASSWSRPCRRTSS